jgi:hypothetical protein
LKSLYLRNINFAAIIFVVDICKPLLIAKQQFDMLLNEKFVQEGDCKIVALVYNARPDAPRPNALSQESLDKVFKVKKLP